jgi:hypothetical protein
MVEVKQGLTMKIFNLFFMYLLSGALIVLGGGLKEAYQLLTNSAMI